MGYSLLGFLFYSTHNHLVPAGKQTIPTGLYGIGEIFQKGDALFLWLTDTCGDVSGVVGSYRLGSLPGEY